MPTYKDHIFQIKACRNRLRSLKSASGLCVKQEKKKKAKMKKYEGETGTAYIFWMGADSHFQLVPLFPICYPSSLFNLETCPKEVSICVRLPQQQNNYQWPRITASNVLTVPPAVQLSSLACDADSAVLARSGSLQQPAHQAAQGASTTQQNKVHEKTLLIHMCLQYILSTSLAGRPNNAFSCRIAKWIILSVLGVTFMCLWECDPYSLCYRREPDAFL